MRIIVLDSDYPAYLRLQYDNARDLANRSYAVQMAHRRQSPSGIAYSYVRSFEKFGHQAQEIYVNNSWAQAAWAREQGIGGLSTPTTEPKPDGRLLVSLKRALLPYRDTLYPAAKRLGLVPNLKRELSAVLEAQIEHYNPDVILNQHIAVVEPSLLRRFKRPGRLIVAQCGVAPPPDLDVRAYDFAISLIPWVVDDFRSKGLRAEQSHLAFDPRVLDLLGPAPEKTIDVSFVGGLSSDHEGRIALLEGIAREFPIELWLSNFKGIRAGSPLHKCYRGEAWDRNMYDVLRRSRITINTHINAARGMAGNVRLYEATGVGTFLLTENHSNLPTLFEPGVEIGAYDSISDCLRQIEYYLAHSPERDEVARCGQTKTLAAHTYDKRVEELLRIWSGLL